MKKLLQISFLISVVFLTSCESKKGQIPSVDHFFQIKKEEAKTDKMRSCKRDAISEAESHVDKLIDRWIQDQGADTINFPRKPSRPRSPEHLIKKSN